MRKRVYKISLVAHVQTGITFYAGLALKFKVTLQIRRMILGKVLFFLSKYLMNF